MRVDSRLALAEVRRWSDRARRRWHGYGPGDLTRVWHVRELGFAFVQVPKVATRSARAAIASRAVSRESEADGESRIDHAIRLYERRLSVSQVRAVTRRCWTFSFVRNPLDRLYSAYADKVLGLGRDLFDGGQLSAPMTFDEFVERVMVTDDDDCDGHLRSQHRYIADSHGPVVSFVGRFEAIEHDWSSLAARLDLPELPMQNVSERGNYRDAYTPRLARLVSERYARDIELFDYVVDVDDLAR